MRLHKMDTLGFTEGVASVTPEDGIGQTDVDAALWGDDSSTPEDGIGQTDVDNAYNSGYDDGLVQ